LLISLLLRNAGVDIPHFDISRGLPQSYKANIVNGRY